MIEVCKVLGWREDPIRVFRGPWECVYYRPPSAFITVERAPGVTAEALVNNRRGVKIVMEQDDRENPNVGYAHIDPEAIIKQFTEYECGTILEEHR